MANRKTTRTRTPEEMLELCDDFDFAPTPPEASPEYLEAVLPPLLKDLIAKRKAELEGKQPKKRPTSRRKRIS